MSQSSFKDLFDKNNKFQSIGQSSFKDSLIILSRTMLTMGIYLKWFHENFNVFGTQILCKHIDFFL